MSLIEIKDKLLKNPEDSDLYVLNFKRLQGDVFSFFECYRSLYEAHYETKFPEVEWKNFPQYENYVFVLRC